MSDAAVTGNTDYIVRELSDADLIGRFLETDRRWTAYALADLDSPFRERAQFVGAFSGESLLSLVLFYDLSGVHACHAFGEGRAVRAIFDAFRPLPRALFAILDESLWAALSGAYNVTNRWQMLRMYVTAPRLRPTAPVSLPVRRLTPDDVTALRALYAGWEEVHVDLSMLVHGVYHGAFDGPALVSVAGTHVVSRRRSVAAVGGVFTHPDYRGRGLATAVTGAVATELARAGIDLIVLNVKGDNEPAIAAYHRLGFAVHASFQEGRATLIPAAAHTARSPSAP